MEIQHYLQAVLAAQGLIIASLIKINVHLARLNGRMTAQEERAKEHSEKMQAMDDRCFEQHSK